MTESYRRLSKPLPFRDLLPWADPYIAGLIQRLRHEPPRRWTNERPLSDARNEASPPLDVDPSDDQDLYFGDIWPHGGPEEYR